MHCMHVGMANVRLVILYLPIHVQTDSPLYGVRGGSQDWE